MIPWPATSIISVVTIVGGGTPARTDHTYYGGEIPWITPKDMKAWNINRSQVFLTPLGLANSPAKLVPEGSVLIVVRSGVLKHSLPIGIARTPVTLNQDMKALVCSKSILPEYLARFIQWRSSQILTWVRATTADNFPIEKLKELGIPIPPIDEQRRIADILDRADEVRAKRRQAVALLDNLTQSIFLDMFGHPNADSTRWPVERFRDQFIEPARNGLSPSKSGTVEARVLTLSAITGAEFNDSAVKVSTFDTPPPPSKSVDHRDFLVCRGNGNLALVGHGHFPDIDASDTTFPDTIIAARVSPNRLEREYLEYVWRSGFIRTQIQAGARTTNGTYKINQKTLESIKLPTPPLRVQQDFGRKIREINVLKKIHSRQLQGAEELFASLQARAFRNEL